MGIFNTTNFKKYTEFENVLKNENTNENETKKNEE